MSLPHGAPAPNEPPLPEPVRPSELPYPEAPAVLCLDGWAGRWEQSVTVIGETPKRYRIRADEAVVWLAGRDRWLELGETALVPKRSVRFV